MEHKLKWNMNSEMHMKIARDADGDGGRVRDSDDMKLFKEPI